jgi:hypothetical protein
MCELVEAWAFHGCRLLANPAWTLTSFIFCFSFKMDSGSTQPTGSAAPSVPKNPAVTSCRKKKSEEATFIEDVRDHIDEFIHASMDEHKTCFKKTIQKVSCTTTLQIVFSFSRFFLWSHTFGAQFFRIPCIVQMFGMSKAVAERSAEAKGAEVESALPLQTSVSQ